tara:strand:- start:1258 stop:2439 length:1182 start_codon:yes stop_codon:yes gene_type:complete
MINEKDQNLNSYYRAQKRLVYFTENIIQKYAQQRNFDFHDKKKNCVSGLSAAINRRIIAEWDVARHVLSFHPYTKVEKFIQEICWRTYWKGYLEHYPSIWHRYIKDVEKMQELKNYLNFKNAVSAKTGIECFDFWMDELKNNGYLHNHSRMWFSSIWTHTLNLPWQLGADVFMQYLLDGDPASNTLSWRWVAGLHTRGKTYLANAENIKKFTGGLFFPTNQLSKTPKFVFEDENHSLKKLEFKQDNREGIQCLLVHESDLLLEGTPECDLVLVQKRPLQTTSRSENVRTFISSALKNYQNELSKNHDKEIIIVDLENIAFFKKIISDRNLISIHTFYPSVGPVYDQIQTMRSHKIQFNFLYRKWDKEFWPHSSKGFFKMKHKIHPILKKLNYT